MVVVVTTVVEVTVERTVSSSHTHSRTREDVYVNQQVRSNRWDCGSPSNILATTKSFSQYRSTQTCYSRSTHVSYVLLLFSLSQPHIHAPIERVVGAVAARDYYGGRFAGVLKIIVCLVS